MSRIGIIGGTGAALFPVGSDSTTQVVDTRWGVPSSALRRWQQHGHEVCFIRRHGEAGNIPPHKVNYRANIQALQDQQVELIIAINAVGGIHSKAKPGSVVIPSQLIDYTSGREHTFYDGHSGELQFVDFTEPFDPLLRAKLVAAAEGRCVPDGIYAVTQGPRLETAAEIDALEAGGCTIVGMTVMPEAGLAREAGIAYASCCNVVNFAAGRSATAIHAEIDHYLESGLIEIAGLIERFLQDLTHN
jgi:5'-methylthioinosine phosphorylase